MISRIWLEIFRFVSSISILLCIFCPAIGARQIRLVAADALLRAEANDPRWRRRRDAASVHFHGKNWPRERGGLGRKFGTMPWLPDTMSWPKVAKTAILQVSSTQLEKNRHQVMKTAKVSVLRWSFRKLYSARVIAPLLPETHLFWVHFQPQHSKA